MNTQTTHSASLVAMNGECDCRGGEARVVAAFTRGARVKQFKND